MIMFNINQYKLQSPTCIVNHFLKRGTNLLYHLSVLVILVIISRNGPYIGGHIAFLIQFEF